MGVCIDLTGQRFGKLTVIKRIENDKHNKAQWLCKCDCGEEVIETSSPLRTGKKIACSKCSSDNLKKKPYREDLSGQKFNRLTVLSYDAEFMEQLRKNKPKAKLHWKCQCECGNICYVPTSSLKNNSVQSCGCLQKEKASKNMKEKIQPIGAKANLIDLTGQKFGKLTVIGRNPENDSFNKPLWVCRCDCGNIKIVNGNSLKNNSTQSCGCLGNSIGENLIKDILIKNNIQFQQEYSFPDLKDKRKLRYDFAIFDKNNNVIQLIEYDGRQYSDLSSIWFNEDLLKRDELKTNYAKEHNIPLLRISYKDKDKISKEFLGIKE